ncbi:MAG: universal stress protein [Nitrospirota bacterium]|nr:universal stress protein [Nitrospirota bacterium]
MYRKILTAVNEHVNSEVAARYAKHLARITGARLLICSVREPGQPERSFDLAREAAKRIQHRARELDIEAETIFTGGRPLPAISAVVRSEGVDLAVVATRRKDVRRQFNARSLRSRSVLLRLPCAVALVHVVHLGRTHPSEILVPLKEHIKDIPSRAFFTAMTAKAFGAKVHLFHVMRPLRTFFQGEVHLRPLEEEGKLAPDLSRFINHLDGYHVEHERHLAPGVAGKSITIEAASRRRDLIIMGASERGIIDFLLRGNPMEYVLRETPCNLIILKTRD